MLLKNKHGEFWLEVKNAVLFSVTQYEGYKDQHYICFHTSNIGMYHQGKPAAHIHIYHFYALYIKSGDNVTLASSVKFVQLWALSCFLKVSTDPKSKRRKLQS